MTLSCKLIRIPRKIILPPIEKRATPMSTKDADGLTGQAQEEAKLAPALAGVLAETKGKLAELEAEHDDLKLLYEATIAHGEAVEDQLAESNILLQRTQARLEEELNEASHYARSILPEPRDEWPSTQWYFEPSTELGGDSFGYHHIDPDHFAIYLIDVCGHGVGAALLSATIINVLRAQADVERRLPGSELGSCDAKRHISHGKPEQYVLHDLVRSA